MEKKRFRLTVAYDGTNYCGWQLQPNVETIEGVLNRRITELTGEEIQVIGASRTDSGVHAYGNIAVFDSSTRIPPDKLPYALNQRLPEDVRVVKGEEVPEDFHPRHCSSRKTYEYRICSGKFPMPTERLYSYFTHFPLQVDKMNQAAGLLVGEHDFTSYCSVHAVQENKVRTLYDMTVRDEGGCIVIRVTGSGFLYNMVRILAGTLWKVGMGAIEPAAVMEILDKRNRIYAGPTLPPQALTLLGIRYLEDPNRPVLL